MAATNLNHVFLLIMKLTVSLCTFAKRGKEINNPFARQLFFSFDFFGNIKLIYNF